MALSECGASTDSRMKELARHGTEGFPVAVYHDDLVRLEVPWHWHEELEVLLVSSGAMELSVGGERLAMRRGDGIFINTGILHACRCRAEEGCRLHSLVFHPRLVGGSTGSVFWEKYLNPLLGNTSAQSIRFDGSTEWGRQAAEALETAWNACADERPGYEFAVRENLSRLIWLLSDISVQKCRPTARQLRDQERIKKMLSFIGEHLSEDLDISRIAGSASLSVSECLRCFHQTVETTPMQYVRGLRLRRAAELLASTDEKVTQIALQCGFQEQSYFARCFRRTYGCTPVEYRGRA